MTPQANVNLNYTKQPLLRERDQQQHQVVPTVTTTVPSGQKKTFFRRRCKAKVEDDYEDDVVVGCGGRRTGGRKCKIKCVLVGDKAVGKTSLAVSYSNDTFPHEYIPTAYDNYNVVVQVDGRPIRVELCDTAGEDELNPLRSLCYPGTDVFMLCFSLVRPSSFEHACTRWADELKRQGAAVVLVGTQVDLVDSLEVLYRLRASGKSPVTRAQAESLALRLDAPYVQTSAKTCNQLKEAFDEAIILALKRKKKQKNWGRRLLCCW